MVCETDDVRPIVLPLTRSHSLLPLSARLSGRFLRRFDVLHDPVISKRVLREASPEPSISAFESDSFNPHSSPRHRLLAELNEERFEYVVFER